MLGAGYLILTGVLKVFTTPLCLRLGWRGGHFFPTIFAGICLGYGFALLTGADPVCCLCICSAALMGAIMRQPVDGAAVVPAVPGTRVRGDACRCVHWRSAHFAGAFAREAREEGLAMNRETVRALCQLNTEFYERNAASFSQTRTAPWEGWRRCMAACGFDGLDEALGPSMDTQIADSVLDIACGNLRFEAFLANTYPHVDWSFFAVDNCEPLVMSGQEDIAKKVHFTCRRHWGVTLLDGLSAAEPANTPAFAAATPSIWWSRSAFCTTFLASICASSSCSKRLVR